MAAGDLADVIGHGDDDKAEGRVCRFDVAPEPCRRDGGPAAYEDARGGPDER
jgi:hypothetical protein